MVTDLGIWHFDESGEMRLDFLHPGATLDEVRATVAWEPKISPSLAPTPAPTVEELRLVREELDPGGRLHEVARFRGKRGPARRRWDAGQAARRVVRAAASQRVIGVPRRPDGPGSMWSRAYSTVSA